MAVEDFFRKQGDEQRAKMEFVRYYSYGCAGVILDPLQLMGMMVNKLDRENLSILAVELGDRYLSKGEKYIDRALKEKTLDDFGGALSTAGLYLFSALMLYKALLADADNGLAIEKAKYCRKALTVADEKDVRVNVSLLALMNGFEGHLARHQERVRAAERNDGKPAAEQVAFELIEMNYFYPRCFSDVLLGNRPSPFQAEGGDDVWVTAPAVA